MADDPPRPDADDVREATLRASQELERYMPRDAKLLPCPFCGEKAVLTNVRESGHSFAIGCVNEFCWRPRTDYYDSEEAVVAMWNRREAAMPHLEAMGADLEIEVAALTGARLAAEQDRDAAEQARADAERELQHLRSQIQFVFLGGGPLEGTAQEQFSKLCEVVDKERFDAEHAKAHIEQQRDQWRAWAEIPAREAYKDLGTPFGPWFRAALSRL